VRGDPTFWMPRPRERAHGLRLPNSVSPRRLVLKSRSFGRAVKAKTVTELRRFLALLALGAIGLHGVTLVLDSTVHVSPLALLVPGLVLSRSTWRSFAR